MAITVVTPSELDPQSREAAESVVRAVIQGTHWQGRDAVITVTRTEGRWAARIVFAPAGPFTTVLPDDVTELEAEIASSLASAEIL